MKKSKFFLISSLTACAVIFCLAMLPVIEKWMLPEMLRDSRNENGSALRFQVEDAQAVVFYPKDSEQGFVETMTSYIFDDLSKMDLTSEKIKVDYRNFYSEPYLFLCFDAVDEHGKLLKVYSGICDTQTHQAVELDRLVSESFYEVVSSELRYQTKASGLLGDLAYTSEFYEKTTKDALRNLEFFLNEEGVEVYIETVLANQNVLLSAELETSLFYTLMKEDQALYQPSDLVHPVRHYVDVNRPMVSLTFDDGPVKKNTELAIELLNTYDARATFFMLGFRMERNHEVVLDVLNSGHEIASHTYNHPDLTEKKTNLSYQYSRNQEILSEITQGQASIGLLRPPYGAFNQKVKESSPYPLILWSLDTLDWKTLDAQATHDHIMTNVKDGDVILLHDLHAPSVESLRTVLPALVDAGYQIVTVSEMMEARGIEMQNGVSYSKARKE